MQAANMLSVVDKHVYNTKFFKFQTMLPRSNQLYQPTSSTSWLLDGIRTKLWCSECAAKRKRFVMRQMTIFDDRFCSLPPSIPISDATSDHIRNRTRAQAILTQDLSCDKKTDFVRRSSECEKDASNRSTVSYSMSATAHIFEFIFQI